MRSIYVYAKKEYPYAIEHCEIMDAAESILAIVHTMEKTRHYIKQILSKTSLTVEQKLTYVAALLTEPEETIHEYGTHDYDHDPVFQALHNERLEVIDTLK
jgi:hypothetical protein